MQDSGAKIYLPYLDAARGIAALMVAAYHFIYWKYGSETWIKLLSCIFNGSDAVSFFFVLSGFVLSFKYIVLQQTLDIRKFYVTRVFRIWPAFFVTLIICTVYWHRGNFDLTRFWEIFFLNKDQFWEEALLFRGHTQYFVAGWTLSIELVMSFFMPFAIVLARKDKRIIYWLLFSTLLMGGIMGGKYIFHFHFLLGIVLSCLYTTITNPSFKNTKWHKYRYLVLVVAFVFFSIRHIDRISELGSTYKYVAEYFGIDFFHYTGLASFVFIVWILQSDNLKKILSHSWFRFIGKISYSIYLMHWIVVTVVFDNWNTIMTYFDSYQTALITVFPICIIVIIILSVLMHRAVEIPMIRYGKRLSQRLKASLTL